MPTQVTSLGTTAAKVAVGESHTCVVKTDGTLWCWGANGSLQLGDASANNTETSPVQVTAVGTTVAQVGVALEHTCVLKTDNSLVCFGGNRFGQLGTDPATVDERSTPATPDGLVADIAQVSMYAYHTCVRRMNNSVYCWGRNAAGDVGLPVDGGIVATPTLVAGLAAIDIAAGEESTCARRTDGTAACWGDERRWCPR